VCPYSWTDNDFTRSEQGACTASAPTFHSNYRDSHIQSYPSRRVERVRLPVPPGRNLLYVSFRFRCRARLSLSRHLLWSRNGAYTRAEPTAYLPLISHHPSSRILSHIPDLCCVGAVTGARLLAPPICNFYDLGGSCALYQFRAALIHRVMT